MCNMLWGLAALGQLTPADLQRVTDRMVALGIDTALTDERELRQLQQVSPAYRLVRVLSLGHKPAS